MSATPSSNPPIRPVRPLATRVALALGALVAPLAPAAAADALDDVVVTSTRVARTPFGTPASVDRIDGSNVRDDRSGLSVADGLSGVPGLSIRDRQNQAQDLQLSVRGFGARSAFGIRGVRLYVDGIPATMPDGQGQMSNIDIDGLDRVEVLRGPFSALYGNSGGGVLQFFTQDGDGRPTLTTSLTASRWHTWRLGLGLSGSTRPAGEPGRLGYTLNVARLTADGYRDHANAGRTNANLKLSWQADADSRLTLVYNSVSLDAQDPLGLTRAQFQADPRMADPSAAQFNTRKSVDQAQAGLTWESRIDAANQLLLTAYAGQRSTTQFQAIPVGPQNAPSHPGGVVDLDRAYYGLDARWTHRGTLADRPFTIVGGLSVDQLGENRRGYQNFTGTGAAQQLGVQGALRRDERNRAGNVDQYVQATWQATDRLGVDLGLRHSHVRITSADRYVVPGNGDDSGATAWSAWLPVAALRFALDPTLNLYAALGRGFETPTLNELSYRPDGAAGMNFGLQPARNRSLEIGAKKRVSGGLATLALFQIDGHDEIVTATSAGGRTTYRNAGATRRRGIELGWQGRHGNWTTQAAYTWLDAHYADGFCSTTTAAGATARNCVNAGSRVPGIARSAMQALAGWQPATGWHGGVEGRYLSRVWVNDANTDAAGAWFTAAVSTGYRWTAGPWSFNAFARLDNVLNRRYAGTVILNDANQRYFEPAAARAWTTGLTARITL